MLPNLRKHTSKDVLPPVLPPSHFDKYFPFMLKISRAFAITLNRHTIKNRGVVHTNEVDFVTVPLQ